MRIRKCLLASSVFIASLATCAVQAATLSVATFNDGWFGADGVPEHFGLDPASNYIAGNCSNCIGYQGEYRDYFEFQIPSFKGTLNSATFVLNADNVDDESGNGIDYHVTSTPALDFADLGTGTEYGSYVFQNTDFFQSVSITLGSAALSDISAGNVFDLSGRVHGQVFSDQLPDEIVFGSFFGLSPQQPTLVLDYTPSAMGAVPEPATWALMLIGFGGAGATLRSRRKCIAA